MSSLTETAYYTRRAINWGILAIGLYIVARILWTFLVTFWLFIFPPKAPPPNHAFQKLPALNFPAPVSSPAAQLQFRLETITGGLPTFASNSAIVYFMPKESANLLDSSRTQNFARRLEFDQTVQQETETIYKFRDPQFPLRTLRYDIVSNNFQLQYAYQQDTGLFTEGTIRDKNLAISEAIEFLNTNNIYQNDFVRGEKKVLLKRLVGLLLIPTESLSTTDAMQVNFFRGSINGFGVVTPNPDEGQIQIIVSGARTPRKQILEVIYTYWPIDYETKATYSLKPVQQAWQQLLDGNGYIAKYPVDGQTVATIRDVYLAYYDSFEPQTYLQPVYVFTGDNGFTAYVHAVNPEWVQ